MKLNSASPFPCSRSASRAPFTQDPARLHEIIVHLREHRVPLCAEFTRNLVSARWLTPLDGEDTLREAAFLFDEYVDALESGRTDSLQDCANHVSERLLARGLDIERILGIVRLLRNLVTRSLFDRFRHVANWGDLSIGASPGGRTPSLPTTPRGWRVVEGFGSSRKAPPITPVPA
jgi:hypothetical protein